MQAESSPEDLFTHRVVKTTIVAALARRIDEAVPGYLFSDRTRVASAAGSISVEPDIVLITASSLRAGLVRLIPKRSSEPRRYVEIEGAAVLIVEIVSDSSVVKDTQRLPVAYHRGGVRELWLVDARARELVFAVHHSGPESFLRVEPDADGFCRSDVLGCHVRLDREDSAEGLFRYELSIREP